MRIITWNVNGLRAVEKKGDIQSLISTYDPDILLMQEIKGTQDKFSPYLNEPTPYTAYYNSAEKAGYAGTGVWIHERVLSEYDVAFASSFPNDPTANEGRVAHIQLIVKSQKSKVKSGNLNISKNLETLDFVPLTLHLFGIYFPNGGKSEEAWQGKLVFYSEFAKYMDSLRERGDSVIWGGDINCAHHAIDLARAKENDGKIGFHPLERAWLDGRVQDGWHDIWREQNPTQTDIYSWWDPVTRSRERNVGWRIDALWCDDSLLSKVKMIDYLTDQYGSDHCPMIIEI